MEIKIQSKDHKEYLDFVIDGLKKYKKANNCIEKIDVYYSSFSVQYKTNIQKPTKLLYIHNHITDYGLELFISNKDMENGNTVMYKME